MAEPGSLLARALQGLRSRSTAAATLPGSFPVSPCQSLSANVNCKQDGPSEPHDLPVPASGDQSAIPHGIAALPRVTDFTVDGDDSGDRTVQTDIQIGNLTKNERRRKQSCPRKMEVSIVGEEPVSRMSDDNQSICTLMERSTGLVVVHHTVAPVAFTSAAISAKKVSVPSDIAETYAEKRKRLEKNAKAREYYARRRAAAAAPDPTKLAVRVPLLAGPSPRFRQPKLESSNFETVPPTRRKRLQRQNETPEQKAKRQADDRERSRRRRETETPAERQVRLNRHRYLVQNRRSHETSAVREARLTAMRDDIQKRIDQAPSSTRGENLTTTKPNDQTRAHVGSSATPAQHLNRMPARYHSRTSDTQETMYSTGMFSAGSATSSGGLCDFWEEPTTNSASGREIHLAVQRVMNLDRELRQSTTHALTSDQKRFMSGGDQASASYPGVPLLIKPKKKRRNVDLPPEPAPSVKKQRLTRNSNKGETGIIDHKISKEEEPPLKPQRPSISLDSEKKDLSDRTCTICNIVFAKRNRLLAHQRCTHFRLLASEPGDTPGGSGESEPDGAFKCDHCPITRHRAQDLGFHKRVAHGIAGASTHLRKDKLARRDVFKEKMSDSGKVTAHQCQTCQRFYSSKQSLRSHLRDTHGNAQNPTRPAEAAAVVSTISCQLCHRVFVNAGSLKIHIMSAHKELADQLEQNQEDASANRTIPCDMCDRKFTNTGYLKLHTVSVHADAEKSAAKDFPCGICQMEFPTQAEYHQHLKSHLSAENLISCPICSKELSMPAYIQHSRRMHTGQLFSCDLCGKQVKFEYSLKVHKERLHGIYRAAS